MPWYDFFLELKGNGSYLWSKIWVKFTRLGWNN